MIMRRPPGWEAVKRPAWLDEAPRASLSGETGKPQAIEHTRCFGVSYLVQR